MDDCPVNKHLRERKPYPEVKSTMAHLADIFHQRAGMQCTPVERPIAMKPGLAEVSLWFPTTQPGRAGAPRQRIVCVTDAPYQAADFLRPVRGLVDLHPFLRSLVLGTLPLWAPIAPSADTAGEATPPSRQDPEVLIYLLTKSALVVLHPTRQLMIHCTGDSQFLEQIVRDPWRWESRPQVSLNHGDDRDCVPWFFSALYNLGHPVGPHAEPALRLLVSLLILSRFMEYRECAVYPRSFAMARPGANFPDLPSQQVLEWIERASASWTQFTGEPFVMPSGSEGVLRDWLENRPVILGRYLAEFHCLARRRTTMEALARAVTSRTQAADYFSMRQAPGAGGAGSGPGQVIIPFDSCGPLGLVLTLQEMLTSLEKRDSSPSKPVRKKQKPGSPALIQDDMFGESAHLVAGSSPAPPTLLERLLLENSTVQVIRPEARELARIFIEGVALEWVIGGGLRWPSRESFHACLPPAILDPTPSFPGL
jgi:hypothetical protein